MPWQEQTIMSQRMEFVQLASQTGANIRELCRRYQISPTTGYKWLTRYAEAGPAGLSDHSRRPQHMPARTPAAITEQILALREEHPTWGGRKLRAWLLAHEGIAVPAASTITAILQRSGRVAERPPEARPADQRFEHPTPNALWQIDFMGHLALGQGRVHPLVVLDDHSRFVLGLFACANEQRQTIQPLLIRLFQGYGMPWSILTDNGPPWGDSGNGGYSKLEVWWLQLGIDVRHGRPAHPQTQGKVERLHRTLAADLLQPVRFPDLATCQQAIDGWRDEYNLERPHEAWALAVPASRYQPSLRPFPRVLPPIAYRPDDVVRKVMRRGYVSYRNRRYKIGTAFEGYPVAMRATEQDGRMAVYFMHKQIRTIDLRTPDPEDE